MISGTVQTGPGPKQRRHRLAKACEPCRRRRVKCNQELPCGACARARDSLACSYRDFGDRSSLRSPAEARAADGLKDVPRRGRPSLEDNGHQLDTSQDHTVDIEVLGRQKQDSAGNRSRESEQPGLTNALQHSGSSVPPVRPRLRHVPDKTKIFGQTHWIHTADKFPLVGDFRGVDVEPAFVDAKVELMEQVKDIRLLRHAVKVQNTVQLSEPLPDIQSTLPPKHRCEALVGCYLRTLEPLYRVFHVPSFYADFHQVWVKKDGHSVSHMFIMKLVLVLAMGTTFCEPDTDEELQTFHYLAQAWIQTVQLWLTGRHEKSAWTLDGVQLSCLILLARQTTYNCPGISSWFSEGSLLRQAISLGLHRDPTIFPTLNPSQRELRKRLWFTVLELSVNSRLDSALPLGIVDFDTPMPSNFNDNDLDFNSKEPPVAKSGLTDSSLQILSARSLSLRLDILRFVNDFRNQQSFDDVLDMGERLRAECRHTATFFHPSHLARGEPSNGLLDAPTKFHRTLLDLNLRRIVLILHKPFMLQALNDRRFYLARKVCVETAMIILAHTKHIDLSLPFHAWDDLARLSLNGRGLFKGPLNFDATLVLALDIITQLQEESGLEGADELDEVARDRRRPQIDCLQGVMELSFQMILRGRISLKRYFFVVAYLSQIQAKEQGQPVKQALYEAITEALGKCHSALQEIRPSHTPLTDMTMVEPSLSSEGLFDQNFLDSAMSDWDIYDLFLPGWNDGQTSA